MLSYSKVEKHCKEHMKEKLWSKCFYSKRKWRNNKFISLDLTLLELSVKYSQVKRIPEIITEKYNENTSYFWTTASSPCSHSYVLKEQKGIEKGIYIGMKCP